MVDGADADVWSQVADGWADLWGGFADPVREVLVREAEVGPGTRVLDAGTGSGELLPVLAATGAEVTGADPAAGMVALARRRHPVVVRAGLERLPFADASFDVVTMVNALQLAGDTGSALAEVARVLAPGGRVAVSGWAEAERNDVDAIEAALAADDGERPADGGPLRRPGGLEEALAAAGFGVLAAGMVDAPWHASDDETLVRGVLLGEDAAGLLERGPVVVAAAAPYADGAGGYLLRNALRWAVGVRG
ncbi:class I SAM-dependent methyltransferase [Nocardioides sp. SYSU D00038]|uniref:class I SAM-dependent methyltransferase n=1 Tax=Nocardioides sp. SYSU D00038 TaxID=2812554 RepID=UPI001967DA2A|nr:methyltransferase domain-containing protein [Nocardioides sp. SYSU D00038]